MSAKPKQTPQSFPPAGYHLATAIGDEALDAPEVIALIERAIAEAPAGRSTEAMLARMAAIGDRNEAIAELAARGVLISDAPPIPARPAPPQRKHKPLHGPRLKLVDGPKTAGAATPSDPMPCRLVDLRTVKEAPIDWLWRGILPGADVSVMRGEKGDGKGTVYSQIAALVSAGGKWPLTGEPVQRGHVLIYQREETLESTTKPRLREMGADFSLIKMSTGVENGAGRPTPFLLGANFANFERTLDYLPDTRLVIFDALGSFLDDGAAKSTFLARQVFDNYALLAKERKIAILFIQQLNKNEDASALNRGSGTEVPLEVARKGWYLARHPESPDKRVMLHLKGNLGREDDTRALVWRLDGERVVFEAERPAWDAQTCLDMMDAQRRFRTSVYFDALRASRGPAPRLANEFRAGILDFLGDRAGAGSLRACWEHCADRVDGTRGRFNQALKHLVESGRVEKIPLANREKWLRRTDLPHDQIVLASDLARWQSPAPAR